MWRYNTEEDVKEPDHSGNVPHKKCSYLYTINCTRHILSICIHVYSCLLFISSSSFGLCLLCLRPVSEKRCFVYHAAWLRLKRTWLRFTQQKFTLIVHKWCLMVTKPFFCSFYGLIASVLSPAGSRVRSRDVPLFLCWGVLIAHVVHFAIFVFFSRSAAGCFSWSSTRETRCSSRRSAAKLSRTSLRWWRYISCAYDTCIWSCICCYSLHLLAGF